MADNAANKGSNTNTIKIIRWTLGIMLMVLIAVGAFNGKTIIQKFKDNTPKEVKYEELKMHIKENQEKRREKYSFIFAFKQTNPILDYLNTYLDKKVKK